MTTQDQIKELFSTLSNTEKRKLIESIEGVLCCPHCKSVKIRKNGKSEDVQRYLCKNCYTTFAAEAEIQRNAIEIEKIHIKLRQILVQILALSQITFTEFTMRSNKTKYAFARYAFFLKTIEYYEKNIDEFSKENICKTNFIDMVVKLVNKDRCIFYHAQKVLKNDNSFKAFYLNLKFNN